MSDPAQLRVREFVDAGARMIELPIREEDLLRVVEDVARIEAVAKFLMQFELDQNIQPAPAFEP